jgi:hypothetical protein
MYEIITIIENMDPTVLGGAVLAITGLTTILAVAALVRYVMCGIGFGKMFQKAGEASWKAWVPFYNTYMNYKISWKGLFFFIYLALTIVAKLPIDMSFVLSAAAIASLVIAILQSIKMAALFGKGKGTGFALAFFPGITSMVLGLGQAEFQK